MLGIDLMTNKNYTKQQFVPRQNFAKSYMYDYKKHMDGRGGRGSWGDCYVHTHTHSHTHEIEQLLFARLVHGRLVHEADHPASPGEPVETLLEQTVADGRLT